MWTAFMNQDTFSLHVVIGKINDNVLYQLHQLSIAQKCNRGARWHSG